MAFSIFYIRATGTVIYMRPMVTSHALKYAAQKLNNQVHVDMHRLDNTQSNIVQCAMVHPPIATAGRFINNILIKPP
jgi:hypothetical protein